MNSNLDRHIRPPLKKILMMHLILLFVGSACSQDMRKFRVQNEINDNNNIIIRKLQQQYKHPHSDPVRRMIYRQANFGHSKHLGEPAIVGQHAKH